MSTNRRKRPVLCPVPLVSRFSQASVPGFRLWFLWFRPLVSVPWFALQRDSPRNRLKLNCLTSYDHNILAYTRHN